MNSNDPNDNSLVKFTNCLVPTESGTLIVKDVWVDQRKGVVVDAQNTFYTNRQRPETIIDLGGNILSPGFLDIQINGAYGFDFSVYQGNDEEYLTGLKTVTEKIVETGVTSFVPTVITQETHLYPKLLHLLRPFSSRGGANILGWHAEGPFLEPAKRGAHNHGLLRSASQGFNTFKDVYGEGNLIEADRWLLSATESDTSPPVGIRIITAAPEIHGVMDAIPDLTERGIIFAVGHSAASSEVAVASVIRGARLITHLFNAMPQLHHRDPSIIGLLGAKPPPPVFLESAKTRYSPYTSPYGGQTPVPTGDDDGLLHTPMAVEHKWRTQFKSEAFSEISTPASKVHSTPPAASAAMTKIVLESASVLLGGDGSPCPSSLIGDHSTKTAVEAPSGFRKPFYDMIVDGIHSHPNSVRLAYSAHPEGCILITDAMKVLDPHLPDGVHEWRDGEKFVKEGDKLYLQGTNTLAGSVVTMDKCVRNFSQFTGCPLGEAIKCATYNPAKCLRIENRKGTLRPGADADLVVLDRDGHVLTTYVKGRKVWGD